MHDNARTKVRIMIVVAIKAAAGGGGVVVVVVAVVIMIVIIEVWGLGQGLARDAVSGIRTLPAGCRQRAEQRCFKLFRHGTKHWTKHRCCLKYQL